MSRNFEICQKNNFPINVATVIILYAKSLLASLPCESGEIIKSRIPTGIGQYCEFSLFTNLHFSNLLHVLYGIWNKCVRRQLCDEHVYTLQIYLKPYSYWEICAISSNASYYLVCCIHSTGDLPNDTVFYMLNFGWTSQ